MHYYIATAEGTRGPYTKDQLRAMWKSGAIHADTKYSAEGMTEWRGVEELVASSASAMAASAARRIKEFGQATAGFAKSAGERIRSGSKSEAASTPELDRKRRMQVAAVGLLLLVVFIIVVNSGSSGKQAASVASAASRVSAPQAEPPNTYPEEVRTVMIKNADTFLEERKQRLFDALHPVGTAKRTKVVDVDIRWKPGSSQRSWEDVSQYMIRFIIYWRGPITTDGYTEVSWTYDTDIERFVAYEVLRTNGITKDEIAKGFLDGVERGFNDWLSRTQ